MATARGAAAAATKKITPVEGASAQAPGAGNDPVEHYGNIARLAYSYWEARGFQGGSAEDDWYRAEEELRDRQTMADPS